MNVDWYQFEVDLLRLQLRRSIIQGETLAEPWVPTFLGGVINPNLPRSFDGSISSIVAGWIITWAVAAKPSLMSSSGIKPTNTVTYEISWNIKLHNVSVKSPISDTRVFCARTNASSVSLDLGDWSWSETNLWKTTFLRKNNVLVSGSILVGGTVKYCIICYNMENMLQKAIIWFNIVQLYINVIFLLVIRKLIRSKIRRTTTQFRRLPLRAMNDMWHVDVGHLELELVWVVLVSSGLCTTTSAPLFCWNYTFFIFVALYWWCQCRINFLFPGQLFSDSLHFDDFLHAFPAICILLFHWHRLPLQDLGFMHIRLHAQDYGEVLHIIRYLGFSFFAGTLFLHLECQGQLQSFSWRHIFSSFQFNSPKRD